MDELLKKRLDAFIELDDFSKSAARGLEESLEPLAENDRSGAVQDLLDVLASYSPGGGDFLYNEADLRRSIERFRGREPTNTK